MALQRHLLSNVSLLFLLIGTFFLSSCGPDMEPPKGDAHSNTAEGISMPVPIQLQKHLSNEMRAEVVVTDLNPPKTFPLTIDQTNRKVSGGVTDLPAGTHTFELNFYIKDKNRNNIDVKVATSRTTAIIVADVTVLIGFASLTYPDNDGDGFTNLAELEVGTDPNDAASHPPAELPRSSANYVMADVIGISPFVGATTSENKSISLGTLPFGSTQTSGNYTVTAGP